MDQHGRRSGRLQPLTGVGQILGIPVQADDQTFGADAFGQGEGVAASTEGAIHDHITWLGIEGLDHLIQQNRYMTVFDHPHGFQSPSSRRSGSSMQFFTCTRNPTASLPSTTRWS